MVSGRFPKFSTSEKNIALHSPAATWPSISIANQSVPEYLSVGSAK